MRFLCLCTIAVSLLSSGAVAQPPADMPLVPAGFVLDEAASKAIAAPWLTEAERSEMRVFHGVWDERDLNAPELRAAAALNAWRFDDPSLADAASPIDARAEGLFLQGELEPALALAWEARSPRGQRLQVEILEAVGRREEAITAVMPLVERLTSTRITEASELVEGVRAMIVRSRLEEQPARDFQTMMALLARARQELDRLYWPAYLAEALLLIEKDNLAEGVQALHQTLSLNPRCAEAWYELGRVALGRFDFGSANVAASALRRLNPAHPLATLLEVESSLIQDDPESAASLLQPLRERWPNLHLTLAYDAAAKALLYDEAAMEQALARCDEGRPRSPIALTIVGRHLSLNRQYDLAATVLERAVERAPKWPAPQIELGLMQLQAGHDDRALAALKSVAALDPFNKRAANSLFLLEELAKYREIETEHFIIRFMPGEDEAMAMLMPAPLERLHEIVASRFGFEPDRKTLIEVHPNHSRFAVRITGMPFVHTIAACTGPVIAMEVPREGPPSRHQGLFDWPRVLQHEYTHTITLGQTRNRIPHWLTEAAAVSMEQRPRAFNTSLMLARALQKDELFSLDEIKWAFVRPRRPNDRALAYAQGHWMVEFMNERFGESALIRLLERYFAGEREQQAMPAALGVSRETFFEDFRAWAADQVKAWGLAPEPALDDLTDELRAADPDLTAAMQASRRARLDVLVRELSGQIGRPTTRESAPRDRDDGEKAKVAPPRGLTASDWPDLARPPVEITDDLLADWLAKHPDHPDLLSLHARRRLEKTEITPETADDASLIGLLHECLEVRPVDPYPHRRLAQIWLASATPERAIEHLEALDLIEEHSPAFALELAKLYRARRDFEKALDKAVRGMNLNPYSAAIRELAASIAIEAGRLPMAREQVYALTLLEPDRPQHQRRLEAVDRMIAGGSTAQ